MAIWPTSLTDLAVDPSQDPDEIVTDTDAVTGIANGQRHGISGEPEAEIGGSETVANFGVSGSFADVDDAAFIPPGGNTVSGASQNFPGQRYSLGFQNEQHVKEGVIDEANLIVQNRPDGSYLTERPT